MVRPVAHASDPVSSWEAAASLKPSKVRKVRWLIVDELRKNGPLTPEELDEKVKHRCPTEHFGYSTIRTRVTELKRLGVIEPVGRKVLPGRTTSCEEVYLTPVMADYFEENYDDMVQG